MADNLELKQTLSQNTKKDSQDLSSSSLPLKQQRTTQKKDQNKKISISEDDPIRQIFGNSETVLDKTVDFIADRLTDLDHAIFQPRSIKEKEERALDEFQQMQLNAQHVKRVFEETRQKTEEEEEEFEEEEYPQEEFMPEDRLSKKEKATMTTDKSSSQPSPATRRKIRL